MESPPNSQEATSAFDSPIYPSTVAENQASSSTAESSTLVSAGRYRPVRFHARGGLGEVHLAVDEELQRTVALKRLQEEHAEIPANRRRFVLEAEITGRLEHPGVVPIYGLLDDQAGRLCYAMRFVEGESLNDAIHRFHSEATKQEATGQRLLFLRQLLTRFVAVCQAVAFAHSKGILHRDLKPANVMLGKFGETLTVDWGLAKRLNQEEFNSETISATTPPTDHQPDSTQMGQTMGTPAFMSPEQAAGKWNIVGPGSDIYSLGATLYMLLTGSTPFQGNSIADVLNRVQRGDFPLPRQVNPAVPPALAAVCCKAMALHPENRYQTAQELAADIERWLGDEPVVAYREPILDRLRRWTRRHRTLVTCATGVLVTAFLGAVILAVQREMSLRQLEMEQAQTEAARRAALTNAAEANQQKEAAEKSATEARLQKGLAINEAREAQRQRQRAAANFGRARDAVDLMLTRVSQDKQLLRFQPGMTAVRRRLLEEALAYYQGFLKEEEADVEVRRETIRAFLRIMDIQSELGQNDKAEDALLQGRKLLAQMVKEFPEDATLLKDMVVFDLERSKLLIKNSRKNEAWAALADAEKGLQALPVTAMRQPGVRYLKGLLCSDRGLWMFMDGNPKEAEHDLREALNLMQPIQEERFPDLPEVKISVVKVSTMLAALLIQEKKYGDAEPLCHQTVALLEGLVKNDPALPTFRQELARAQNYLAQVFIYTKQLNEAEKAFVTVIDLRRKIADEYPTVPDCRFDLGSTLNDLGYFYWIKPDKKKAETLWREAMTLWDRLLIEVPDNHFYRTSRSGTAGNLAKLLLERNLNDEALSVLRKATEDDRVVLKANPRQQMTRFHFRNNSCDLYTVFLRKGQHAEAAAVALDAHHLLPDSRDVQYNLACCLALCVPAAERDASLAETKRKEVAQAYGDQAVQVIKELVEAKSLTAKQFKEETDFDAIRSREDLPAALKRLK